MRRRRYLSAVDTLIGVELDDEHIDQLRARLRELEVERFVLEVEMHDALGRLRDRADHRISTTRTIEDRVSGVVAPPEV